MITQYFHQLTRKPDKAGTLNVPEIFPTQFKMPTAQGYLVIAP